MAVDAVPSEPVLTAFAGNREKTGKSGVERQLRLSIWPFALPFIAQGQALGSRFPVPGGTGKSCRASREAGEAEQGRVTGEQ